ncbi:hypothetical protein HDV05_007691 [Chytridiales sp. JEL 0842]|nr:hypothetical protein HDV05_007691 [Chytridiales sp. JEL 0842]
MNSFNATIAPAAEPLGSLTQQIGQSNDPVLEGLLQTAFSSNIPQGFHPPMDSASIRNPTSQHPSACASEPILQKKPAKKDKKRTSQPKSRDSAVGTVSTGALGGNLSGTPAVISDGQQAQASPSEPQDIRNPFPSNWSLQSTLEHLQNIKSPLSAASWGLATSSLCDSDLNVNAHMSAPLHMGSPIANQSQGDPTISNPFDTSSLLSNGSLDMGLGLTNENSNTPKRQFEDEFHASDYDNKRHKSGNESDSASLNLIGGVAGNSNVEEDAPKLLSRAAFFTVCKYCSTKKEENPSYQIGIAAKGKCTNDADPDHGVRWLSLRCRTCNTDVCTSAEIYKRHVCPAGFNAPPPGHYKAYKVHTKRRKSQTGEESESKPPKKRPSQKIPKAKKAVGEQQVELGQLPVENFDLQHDEVWGNPAELMRILQESGIDAEAAAFAAAAASAAASGVGVANPVYGSVETQEGQHGEEYHPWADI